MTSLFLSPNKWPIIFYRNEYPSNFKLITSIKEIEIFIMVKEELKSNNWFFQPNKLTTVYNWWSYCKSVWFMQEIVIFIYQDAFFPVIDAIFAAFAMKASSHLVLHMYQCEWWWDFFGFVDIIHVNVKITKKRPTGKASPGKWLKRKIDYWDLIINRLSVKVIAEGIYIWETVDSNPYGTIGEKKMFFIKIILWNGNNSMCFGYSSYAINTIIVVVIIIIVSA